MTDDDENVPRFNINSPDRPTKTFDCQTDDKMTKRKLRSRHYTQEEKLDFLEYIRKSNGFVTIACQNFGIPMQTLCNWRSKSPEFEELVRKVVIECEDKKGDFAESMLMKNISDGKEQSIFFYLRNQHKSRGYLERSEQHIKYEPQGQPTKIEIMIPGLDPDS